jgi:hypothetical protein
VAAETGEVDEYGTLDTLAVSPEVSAAVADWLGRMLPPR